MGETGFWDSIVIWLKSFDLSWLEKINHGLQNPFFDWLLPLISMAGGGGMIWIVFSLVLLTSGRSGTKKVAILMLMSLFISFLAGEEGLKHYFQRPRPFETIPDVDLLVKPPGSYSFPSGHAANAFASGLVLARMIPVLAWPVLILAALMAFSRVYVGVHYPLDVIAGSLLGAACALLVLKFESSITRTVQKIPPFRTLN